MAVTYPCNFLKEDGTIASRVHVNCKMMCLGCGFNPVEVKRRMAFGFRKQTVEVDGKKKVVKGIIFEAKENPYVVH